MAVDPINLKESGLCESLLRLCLLAVLGGLAVFLTFSSSWGALLAPQAKAEPIGA
jgi:hypothetical protein